MKGHLCREKEMRRKRYREGKKKGKAPGGRTLSIAPYRGREATGLGHPAGGERQLKFSKGEGKKLSTKGKPSSLCKNTLIIFTPKRE